MSEWPIVRNLTCNHCGVKYTPELLDEWNFHNSERGVVPDCVKSLRDQLDRALGLRGQLMREPSGEVLDALDEMIEKRAQERDEEVESLRAELAAFKALAHEFHNGYIYPDEEVFKAPGDELSAIRELLTEMVEITHGACGPCSDKDKRIEELETLHRELVEELNSDPEAHLMGWEGDDD